MNSQLSKVSYIWLSQIFEHKPRVRSKIICSNWRLFEIRLVFKKKFLQKIWIFIYWGLQKCGNWHHSLFETDFNIFLDQFSIVYIWNRQKIGIIESKYMETLIKSNVGNMHYYKHVCRNQLPSCAFLLNIKIKHLKGLVRTFWIHHSYIGFWFKMVKFFIQICLYPNLSWRNWPTACFKQISRFFYISPQLITFKNYTRCMKNLVPSCTILLNIKIYNLKAFVQTFWRVRFLI